MTFYNGYSNTNYTHVVNKQNWLINHLPEEDEDVMAVLVLRLHLSTRELHFTMDFHLYVRGLEIMIVWSKNDSYTGTINIWLHVILKHAILYFIKWPTPRWDNNLILNLISLICTKDALTRNLQHIKLQVIGYVVPVKGY